MSLIIDEHRQYLADASRISSYRAAITQVVRPGDVVVDLGSGTGILGLLACAAGAARVYAIDAGGMAEPARAIARANGFGDRVTVIDGWSRHVELPGVRRAGHRSGRPLRRGRHRSQQQSRATLPAEAGGARDLAHRSRVAPIDAPDVVDAIEFWSRRPPADAHDMAANSGYPRGHPAVGAARPGGARQLVDLTQVTGSSWFGRVAVERAGTLSGIGGWFSATLAPGVTMSNSPLAADLSGGAASCSPIARPAPVAPGDRVRNVIQFCPTMCGERTVELLRRGGAARSVQPHHAARHADRAGQAQTDAAGVRTAPEPARRARRAVLERALRAAGHRRDRAGDVRSPRPDLPRSRHAAVFVAEVMAGYSL